MSKALESNKIEKKPFNYKYQRDKDREMVKGIFRFHEAPGGGMSFIFKLYKEDQVERYDLTDGEVYTLPLGVARHLNKNGWYPVYEYMKDEQTHNIQRIGQKVRRFSFQSLEFIDMDDLRPEGKGIITVEQVV